MTRPSLETVFQHHRQQRYSGPTPNWPLPMGWRRPILTAMAAAAALALLATPWLGSENDFGRNYTPRPSAYSALKRARQATPELPPKQRNLLTTARLPAIPQRQSRFAPPNPDSQSEASIRLLPTPALG
ncbi:MAG: hypothetical protein AB8B96_17795 [Lysobacterales bacterium]